ncbi:MAG: alpha/beta hydrolase [Burkholderiales bacterium]|nr:alpha/beta hydrolase [Burkholderiales bacterium]
MTTNPAPRMHTQLVTIPTDTIPLDGVLYEPVRSNGRAAIYFHGNTMNFYTGAARFLAPALVSMGYNFLAFNRRGHDVLTTRASRVPEGGAFQTTGEALADNRYAAHWLAARGFAAPVVIGHSNGGMLGVQHVVDHPQTPALVLLSAGRGGPHSSSGGPEKLLAQDRHAEFEAQAHRLVAAGHGRELLLLPGWWYVISAGSFLDRNETVPETVPLAAQLRCPVITIRGSTEDRGRYPAEEFQANCGGPCTVEIIANCDHFYVGREAEVTQVVTAWLDRMLPQQ